MPIIKVEFIVKHLLVAETFAINHWGIQGCTPEECPGKNPYLYEEEQIFICILWLLNWKRILLVMFVGYEGKDEWSCTELRNATRS